MASAINGILSLFRTISSIPRLSGHEAQLRNWILKWAKKHRFESTTDAVGNAVVRVPASAGYEDLPPVVLQSHLDMVGEKEADVTHDFTTDPIKVHQDGDWLYAKGTTLGADDGIGVALSLYVATDPKVPHPPLELLFTVDEESGLTGASKIDSTLITSRFLINIDSEDEGILINGCAGGSSAAITFPFPPHHPPHHSVTNGIFCEIFYRVSVTNMPGGHSGVDINKNRGNAIVTCAQLISDIIDELKGEGIFLAYIEGGSAHNAIPRNAHAILAMPSDTAISLISLIVKFQYKLRIIHSKPDIKVAIKPIKPMKYVENNTKYPIRLRNPTQTKALLKLIKDIPNGALHIRAMPLLSANIARICCNADEDQILVSLRGNDEQELRELEDKVHTVATANNARCQVSGQYPAWNVAKSSVLTAHCTQVYSRVFDSPLSVECIHAGLEPAVIAKNIPNLDMVSIGPTMQNPHSPQECLSVSSTQKLYQFLAAILSEWKNMAH